tara:strand:- start:1425 stop:2213 length:789 start_codon:yes stop_codon:yes gene_type:complete
MWPPEVNCAMCSTGVFSGEMFMKFLVTNDDGIDAPGIRALVRAASRFGEVVVVGPEEAHSGCGHRVTTGESISVRLLETGWWAIGGTPADCTRVGLREIASDCDWVLAGVNAGANLGVDVFMSGTVAAVREAALLGRPGIAFSHYRAREGAFDWGYAAGVAERVMERILSDSTEAGCFWNVNMPDLSVDRDNSADTEGRASRIVQPELIDCPVGRGHLPVDFVRDGSTLTYRGIYQERPRETGDDVDVCFGGNVAVTRMGIW